MKENAGFKELQKKVARVKSSKYFNNTISHQQINLEQTDQAEAVRTEKKYRKETYNFDALNDEQKIQFKNLMDQRDEVFLDINCMLGQLGCG